MAPRSKTDAAGIAHQVWRQVCALAEETPAEFTAGTREGADGWLWEGPGAALMRRAAADVPDGDRRRARQYLQDIGMIVNVSGGAPPTWFIRKDWQGSPAGHVHLMPRESPPPQKAAEQAAEQAAVRAAAEPEGQYEGVAEAVMDLVSRVGGLEAGNDELRAENDRLRAENDRLAAENTRLRDAARKAARLLAEFGE